MTITRMIALVAIPARTLCVALTPPLPPAHPLVHPLGLQLLPISTGSAETRSTLLRIVWREDSATREIRRMLPQGPKICRMLPQRAIVVSLFGKPAADTKEPARLARLLEALKAGACLISEAFSLQEAIVRAHAKAQKVHLSGLSGARASNGTFRRTAKQRAEVPAEERLNVFGHTKLPPAALGQTQPLTLYIYHDKQQSTTPDAAGGRKIKTAKEGGVESQYSWSRSTRGLRTACRFAVYYRYRRAWH
jgi:hypothetical protein